MARKKPVEKHVVFVPLTVREMLDGQAAMELV
jgi:hypothetical protein